MKLLRKLQHSIEQLNKVRVEIDTIVGEGLDKAGSMLDDVIKDMEQVEHKLHKFSKDLKDLGKKYKD